MQIYKKLIEDFFKLLKDLNTPYIQEYGYSLFLNINILYDTIKDSRISNNIISYSILPLKIKIPENLSHTIPTGAKDIVLCFSVKNISITQDKDIISNPIKKLDTFNIVIKGKDADENELISSWHLDKKIISDTYNCREPEFHFTFGGYKMENESKENNLDYGQLLLLRTPRIMHPPLDLILGIDFILNNYMSKKYSGIFINEKKYIKIINQVKELIWQPYALAFAKKMQNDFSKIDKLKFDSNFVDSITG